MTFVGLAVTFLGFVIAFVSLGVTDSTTVRMGMVLVGHRRQPVRHSWA